MIFCRIFLFLFLYAFLSLYNVLILFSLSHLFHSLSLISLTHTHFLSLSIYIYTFIFIYLICSSHQDLLHCSQILQKNPSPHSPSSPAVTPVQRIENALFSVFADRRRLVTTTKIDTFIHVLRVQLQHLMHLKTQLMDLNLQRLRMQNSELKDRLQCRICFYGHLEVAIVPCGHTFCKSCATRFSACPQCRGTIMNTQPVFFQCVRMCQLSLSLSLRIYGVYLFFLEKIIVNFFRLLILLFSHICN